MALKNPFKDLREGISSALVDMTRTVGHITNEDLAFHRSSSPSIVPLLEQQNSRLLRLAGRLAKTATSGTEVTPPQLLNTDSVDDSWNKIVDVFDNILEKADACLDEYTGIIRKEVNLAEQGYISKAKSPLGKQRPGKAYRTQNIPKPQLLFDRVPTNDLTTPFKPLLRSKPNSIVSLDQSLQPVAAEDGSNRYSLRFYLS